MNGLNHWLRDYFGFSATELRGFWLLTSAALVILAFTAFLKPLLFLTKPDVHFLTTNQLDSLVGVLEQLSADEPQQWGTQVVASGFKPFNPNSASSELMKENGIPEWLVDRIVKYRKKGGRFQIKDDLLKIYGFPEDVHAKLYPYILLPVQQKKIPATQVHYRRKKDTSKLRNIDDREIEKININTVDSTTLQQLSGIGVILSARIVRFRNKLGGFYSLDQLSEIYHITPEVVETLKNHTYLSPEFPLNKININQDDVSTLASHPYISFSLAKAIVKHRDNYGGFESLEDCREVYLMEESIFRKLRPYLNF
jgi:DNA uptake protein ComE-like DNA-binding protein